MTPIGQPCACEPLTWLYFLFVQSLFVFVELTRTAGAEGPGLPLVGAYNVVSGSL
jgi:hypothetical protein